MIRRDCCMLLNISNIKLNFLDADKKYEAVIYADAQSAHWDRNPTAYQISTKQISKYESLHIKLAAGGGQAISIKPVE